MKKILEELWNGRISPNEVPRGYTKEYQDLIQIMKKQRAEVLNVMGEDKDGILISYDEAVSDVSYASATEAFIRGFKLGAGIMAEVFAET